MYERSGSHFQPNLVQVTVRVDTIHKHIDEPGHRSGSKENESRVGTNVSEPSGGEVGTLTLVSVTAPAVGLTSHRSNTATEQNPSGSILPQRPRSRDGAAQEQGGQEGGI